MNRSILVSLFVGMFGAVISPVMAQEAPAGRAAARAKAAASVALLKPEGLHADLPEMGASLTNLMLGGGGKPKGFYTLIDRLGDLADKAATTPVLIDLTGAPVMNLAQCTELGRALAELRKSRKVIAYLENAGLVELQIAAACDQVLMADMGMVDLRSLAMTVLFMKDALDLLGVQMDVIRCGDFKGAVEPFMQSSMSRHLREHYREMLASMNDDLVARIARGRKLEAEQVRALQGQRLLTALQAKEAGLVDTLVPWVGATRALQLHTGDSALTFEDAMKDGSRRTVNPLAMLTELFAPKREKDIDEEAIAVLHLSGAIVDGDKAQAGSIVSGASVREIERLKTNAKVKGVVVRINSPGGSATASEAILLALKELAAAKPVVVSMGEMAASGGYYVACFGRPILAEAGTITGSIGVFGMKPNLGTLMRRVGIKPELIALDESSSMDALDMNWNDEQKASMQAFVDSIYRRFVQHAATSRNLSESDVLAVAGGRVWSGTQAVQRKLVDRIGGLEEAIQMIKAEAGLGDGVEIQHVPTPKSIFETLASSFGGETSVLVPHAFRTLLKESGDLEAAVRLVLDAGLSTTPRVYARLPVDLKVR